MTVESTLDFHDQSNLLLVTRALGLPEDTEPGRVLVAALDLAAGWILESRAPITRVNAPVWDRTASLEKSLASEVLYGDARKNS